MGMRWHLLSMCLATKNYDTISSYVIGKNGNPNKVTIAEEKRLGYGDGDGKVGE